MAIQFTDPFDSESHIGGIRVRRLRVNSDDRGNLVETLKVDWEDFYDDDLLPFKQTYYSVTHPGVARDEDQWHVHQNQRDRFVVIDGDLVVGVHDPRPGSPTNGRINLFRMGSAQGPDGQYALMIPEQVHHGFVVSPAGRAILTNFPTQLYDPEDEGRIAFADAGARFGDGRPFSWEAVRKVLQRD
jgi:dTDP-4-dehydrorhamnose 3,5-epimerase